MQFNSRRSPVLTRNGMVATSQPLAAMAGVEVLRAGGNAADAAVAVAAALNVVEPTSTGIGGDCFALFYEAATKQVYAVNGSGRSGRSMTLEALRERGVTALPPTSVHSVTVPGAAAGWADTVARHGRMPLAAVLAPAIRLAEEGHPVSPVVARYWDLGAPRLRSASPHGGEMLIDGRAPRTGEVWRNPNLGGVFRELGEGGAEAFYTGRTARAIAKVVQDLGGWITEGDLAAHRSTFEPPISTTYRGYTVYECAPNGQGIVALEALNIVEGYDLASLRGSGVAPSVEYLHVLIEACRLAFEDARASITDPAFADVPTGRLLSKQYAAERRALIDPARSRLGGAPVAASDTAYMSVVDGEGNACSFIDSNYNGFGTGIVPQGCGFTLQNRGTGFSLDPAHPNRVEGGKRPYHTIIPALSTDARGDLHACFGVMGGFHQPQGHLQVFANMVDHGMDPQAAIDEPRFSLYSQPPSGPVHLEDAFGVDVIAGLARLGHHVVPMTGFQRTAVFGRGQIITRDPASGVLWGGSDGRTDGAAVGW